MTKRIDHAVEARKVLEDLEPHRGQHLELDSQLAQVHATLALVEQQRIANVIALHRHEVEYDVGWDRSYLYESGTDDLFQEMKEALGL